MTTWAHALASGATDKYVTDQLDYWMDTTSGEDPLLGVRRLDQTTDTRGTADAVGIHLDQDTTTAVLTRLPELLTADVNDILLGALTVALGAWRPPPRYRSPQCVDRAGRTRPGRNFGPRR